MKRLTFVRLCVVDRAMNDADILEICALLPNLRVFRVHGSGSSLTFDGATEWKRMCPDLSCVSFDESFVTGGGVSEEVGEELRGLGVRVRARVVL
jgi:hypothetical protein